MSGTIRAILGHKTELSRGVLRMRNHTNGSELHAFRNRPYHVPGVRNLPVLISSVGISYRSPSAMSSSLPSSSSSSSRMG